MCVGGGWGERNPGSAPAARPVSKYMLVSGQSWRVY